MVPRKNRRRKDEDIEVPGLRTSQLTPQDRIGNVIEAHMPHRRHNLMSILEQDVDVPGLRTSSKGVLSDRTGKKAQLHVRQPSQMSIEADSDVEVVAPPQIQAKTYRKIIFRLKDEFPDDLLSEGCASKTLILHKIPEHVGFVRIETMLRRNDFLAASVIKVFRFRKDESVGALVFAQEELLERAFLILANFAFPWNPEEPKLSVLPVTRFHDEMAQRVESGRNRILTPEDAPLRYDSSGPNLRLQEHHSQPPATSMVADSPNPPGDQQAHPLPAHNSSESKALSSDSESEMDLGSDSARQRPVPVHNLGESNVLSSDSESEMDLGSDSAGQRPVPVHNLGESNVLSSDSESEMDLGSDSAGQRPVPVHNLDESKALGSESESEMNLGSDSVAQRPLPVHNLDDSKRLSSDLEMDELPAPAPRVFAPRLDTARERAQALYYSEPSSDSSSSESSDDPKPVRVAFLPIPPPEPYMIPGARIPASLSDPFPAQGSAVSAAAVKKTSTSAKSSKSKTVRKHEVARRLRVYSSDDSGNEEPRTAPQLTKRPRMSSSFLASTLSSASRSKVRSPPAVTYSSPRSRRRTSTPPKIKTLTPFVDSSNDDEIDELCETDDEELDTPRGLADTRRETGSSLSSLTTTKHSSSMTPPGRLPKTSKAPVLSPDLVRLPRTPYLRARRILTPDAALLPKMTVVMRGDIQFFYPGRSKDWIAQFSQPQYDPRHVLDACLLDETAVIAYDRGPCQIALIHLPEVHRSPIVQPYEKPAAFHLKHAPHTRASTSNGKPQGSDTISCLSSGPSRRSFLTGGYDKYIRTWTLDEDRLAKTNSTSTTKLASVASALACQDGKLYVGSSRTLSVMNMESLHRLSENDVSRTLSSPIRQLHVDPRNPNIIITEVNHLDNQMELHDLREHKSKAPAFIFGYRAEKPPTRYGRGAMRGKYFVRGFTDGEVRLWDIRTNLKRPLKKQVHGDVAHCSASKTQIIAFGDDTLTFLDYTLNIV